MCVQFSLLQNCPLTDWTGSLQSVNGTLTALVMFMQLVGWVGTVGLTWQTWAYPQSLITTLKNVHLFLEEARILHALLCSSFHNVITFTCDATPSSLTETNFTGCWCGIFWRGNIQWTCLAVKWEVAVVGSYFSQMKLWCWWGLRPALVQTSFSVVKAACFCFPDVSTQRLAVWRVARAGLTLSVGFEYWIQSLLPTGASRYWML